MTCIQSTAVRLGAALGDLPDGIQALRALLLLLLCRRVHPAGFNSVIVEPKIRHTEVVRPVVCHQRRIV